MDISYRFEKRSGGKKVSIIFLLPKCLKDIITPGKKNHKRWICPIRLPRGVDPSTMSKEEILSLVPTFLRRLDTALKNVGRNIRNEMDLPLAAIWVIDQDTMCQQNKWKSTTYKEYQNTFNGIIKLWGDMTLAELTPKSCSAALTKMSAPSRRRRVIRALKLLYMCEAAYGHYVHDKWSTYHYQEGKPTFSPEKCIRQNILTASIAYSELYKLLSDCYSQLSGMSSQGQKRRYFGLLLKLILPLSDAELCALRCKDFELLPEYQDRLTVRITNEYSKSYDNKSCSLNQITDPYRLRILPLPKCVHDAYKRLFQGNDTDENLPLIPHPKNAIRSAPPDTFARWAANTLKAGSCAELFQDLTTAQINWIISNTFRQGLMRAGCEDDEMNYFYGRPPKSVAGLHYCDFGNNAEINRLGALVDRWLSPIPINYKATEKNGNIIFKRKDKRHAFRPAAGQRCVLDITMDFPSLPAGSNAYLQITTHYGADISAAYISTTKGGSTP